MAKGKTKEKKEKIQSEEVGLAPIEIWYDIKSKYGEDQDKWPVFDKKPVKQRVLLEGLTDFFNANNLIPQKDMLIDIGTNDKGDSLEHLLIGQSKAAVWRVKEVAACYTVDDPSDSAIVALVIDNEISKRSTRPPRKTMEDW